MRLFLLITPILMLIPACATTKGVYGMKHTDKPIVVKHTFNQQPSVVWKAITDPGQMKQWLFEPIERFEPKVGFETVFVVDVEGTRYPHRWKVTEAEVNKKVQLSWKYDGFAGAAVVTFQLNEVDEDKTELQLTHIAIEDFGDEEIFSRKIGEEGWNFLIKESLQKHLEKN